ncbi:MAG TPA: hypothetical protein PLY06_01050, partial [Anaerolineaceae bacterium]|nr:hypothetical protein [Anaerolineaceae bacterium]
MASHPYPDHLFGDLDQAVKGAQRHLAQNKGLHHAYRVSPWLPEPGKPFRLNAASSLDLPFREVSLRYSLDGAAWQEKPFEGGDYRWDGLTWCWQRDWLIDLPAMEEG